MKFPAMTITRGMDEKYFDAVRAGDFSKLYVIIELEDGRRFDSRECPAPQDALTAEGAYGEAMDKALLAAWRATGAQF